MRIIKKLCALLLFSLTALSSSVEASSTDGARFINVCFYKSLQKDVEGRFLEANMVGPGNVVLTEPKDRPWTQHSQVIEGLCALLGVEKGAFESKTKCYYHHDKLKDNNPATRYSLPEQLHAQYLANFKEGINIDIFIEAGAEAKNFFEKKLNEYFLRQEESARTTTTSVSLDEPQPSEASSDPVRVVPNKEPLGEDGKKDVGTVKKRDWRWIVAGVSLTGVAFATIAGAIYYVNRAPKHKKKVSVESEEERD